MQTREEPFAAKLLELEREYGLLRTRVQIAQQMQLRQLRRELKQALEQCRDDVRQLEESVHTCRSPAVAALSSLQQEYGTRMEQLLRQELPDDMRGRNSTEALDQAEATALYAEYAIDFATQSMHQALAAALAAILLLRQADTHPNKGDV